MLPFELEVVARLGSDSHEALVEAVSAQGGYLLVSGSLYEVMTWRDLGDGSTRWVLQRAEPFGDA